MALGIPEKSPASWPFATLSHFKRIVNAGDPSPGGIARMLLGRCVEESVRALAICSQGTVEGGERLAECSRDTLHDSRFAGVELFMTEAEEG